MIAQRPLAASENLEPWAKVPPTFDEICDWAVVVRDGLATDHTRQQAVIYKSPGDVEAHMAFAVTLRVQGFLDSFCLGATGDWNG